MASRKRKQTNDATEERPSKRQCLDAEEKRRWKRFGACGRCITRSVRLKKGEVRGAMRGPMMSGEGCRRPLHCVRS